MSDSQPTGSVSPRPDGETMPPPHVDQDRTLSQPQVLTLDVSMPAVPGYEMLGELGRGGMGVVYKARQLKLNRVVALKMILAGNYASQSDLIRFLAEAEAVAAVQHPNIVQIFEVSRLNRLPYFTLEYVDGGTLSDKVRDEPLPPRDAAALVEKVARGVQFAHEKGLVHRDLKPDNILVTSDGTPKVADFGLAKRVQIQSELTRTGTVLGTPSYMAPEQADGKGNPVGPLADVYALGAILYRLISGWPPFQAATPLDTLVRVVCDDPVPPSKLQSKTPKDLETICLKCLQKEPAKRYDSASALADDLNRFLRGEPILARPVGALERGLKWVKRNPVVTALLAAVIASLFVGALVSYLKYRDAAWHRNRAEEARNAEAEQRKLAETARNAEAEQRKLAETARNAEAEQRRIAEKARDRTREALEAMTSEVTGESLNSQKEISEEQRKFLAEALTFYKEFAGEKADDKEARVRTASAAHRVGMIQWRLGQADQAMAAFAQARDEYERLAADFRADPEYLRSFGWAHNNLGVILSQLGKYVEAVDECQKALEIREKVIAEFPGPGRYYQELALSHTHLASGLIDLGRPKEAEAQFHQAITILKTLTTRSPSVPEYRQDLAASHNQLAALLDDLSRQKEAEAQYRQALKIRKQLVADSPTTTAYRRELAITHNGLGTSL